MASKWYFRSSNAPAGPSATASTDTDYFTGTPSDKNTAKYMWTGKGSSQTSSSGSYNNAGANRLTMYRIWVSPPLAAQTLTGSQANYKFAAAFMESSALQNLFARWFAYVWRSGSGNVKTIIVPTSCGTEHGTAERGCVVTATGASGDYSIQAGDRIVVEGWFSLQNTKSASYTATGYYEGATDPVDGIATSDAAGYFECPQTLLLQAVSVSKLSDARFKKAATVTKSSDSRFKKTTLLTLMSDAKFGSIMSYTIQKFSDARFKVAQLMTKFSNARFKKTQSLSKLSDARFKKSLTLSRLADARFKKTMSTTKSSDARFKTTTQFDAPSDARFKAPRLITKLSDARFGTEAPPAETPVGTVIIWYWWWRGELHG